MKQSIMFGICTYNRKSIMEMSSASLARVKGIQDVNVQVFDDHSQEYDTDYLHSRYPFAKSIVTSDTNTGADANSIRMLRNFLSGSEEWLFIADSDLLYCESLMETIQTCIEEYNEKGYKGVISLFNTYTHPVQSTIDSLFCRKDEVGAAGVLMHRETVKLIVDSVNSETAYDVQFSRVLLEKGYDILCTNRSYVQHIGIEGYNSLYYTFDWGKDFLLDSFENAEALIQTVDLLMKKIADNNNKSVESRIREDVENRRIGIKKLTKILLSAVKRKLA